VPALPTAIHGFALLTHSIRTGFVLPAVGIRLQKVETQ